MSPTSYRLLHPAMSLPLELSLHNARAMIPRTEAVVKHYFKKIYIYILCLFVFVFYIVNLG